MSEIQELINKEYYEENILFCIPLYIFHHSRVNFDKFNIIQGVEIASINIDEAEIIKKSFIFIRK